MEIPSNPILKIRADIDFETFSNMSFGIWKQNDSFEINIDNLQATFAQKDVNGLSCIYVSTITDVEITTKRKDLLEEFKKTGQSICVESIGGQLNEFFNNEGHYKEVIENTRKVFNLFRWRFNLMGNTNKEFLLNVFWQSDNNEWNKIVSCPAPTNLKVSAFTPIDINEVKKQFNDFISFSGENIKEPIYHSLIREAHSIKQSNYKSAFAISIAALETATKEFLANKLEDAKALIYEFPSPDLYKIYSLIIPRIKGGFELNPNVLKKIKTLMSERNQLMHKGQSTLTTQKTFEFIELIQNIIFLIDYYSGNIWSSHSDAIALLNPVLVNVTTI